MKIISEKKRHKDPNKQRRATKGRQRHFLITPEYTSGNSIESLLQPDEFEPRA